MMMYAGLDVSDKTTHICLAKPDGPVLRRDVVSSDPDLWLSQERFQLACCLSHVKSAQ